jgi:hypothetical protein
MVTRNLLFIRAYFEARKEAEAAGLDGEQSKGYAVSVARSEVQDKINAILYS